MEKLAQLMKEMFLSFFGREDWTETLSVAASCLVAGTLALWLVGKVLGGYRSTFVKSLFLLSAGAVFVAAGWVLPAFFGLEAVWAPPLAALLVFLAVVSITAWVDKGGFLAALAAWIITGLVVWVVLTLDPYVRNSISRAIDKGSRLQEHRQKVESPW